MVRASIAAVFLLLCSCLEVFGQSPGDVPSLWSLNDSVMRLEVNGDSRSFFYQNPRSGLLAVGVTAGTLQFQGVLNGSVLNGTAYVFSKKCGAIGYPSTGYVNGQQIVLEGQYPLVDPDTCRPRTFRNNPNVFNLISVLSAPSVPEQPVITQQDVDQAREQGRQDGEQQGYQQGQQALASQIDQLKSQLGDAITKEQAAEAESFADQQELAALRKTRPFAPVLEAITPCERNTLITTSMVAWTALFLRIFSKLVQRREGSFRRDVVLETCVNVLTSIAMRHYGMADDYTLIAIPTIGGLTISVVASGIAFLHNSEHSYAIA